MLAKETQHTFIAYCFKHNSYNWRREKINAGASKNMKHNDKTFNYQYNWNKCWLIDQ